jgi:hypothetical protein
MSKALKKGRDMKHIPASDAAKLYYIIFLRDSLYTWLAPVCHPHPAYDILCNVHEMLLSRSSVSD